MFDLDRLPPNEALDGVISNLIETLNGLTDKNGKEYSSAADTLVKLVKVKNETSELNAKIAMDRDKQYNETVKLNLDSERFQFEKDKASSWRPSPDAVIGVVATIATAALVLNFERVGVITTRAFAFIGKSLK